MELIQIGFCPLGKFSWHARWLAKLRRIFERKRPRLNPIISEGPKLWTELHQWALYADIDRPLLWLGKFREKLLADSLGCACVARWDKLCADHPVPLDRDELFAWTVDRHNDVNRDLGKAEITLEDARKRWNK